MGIEIFGGSGGGTKTQKFALFNSSSTWTAPTSANYDGVVKAFLVAGGGGGGGGAAGAVSTSNQQGRPGGSGGGGGGGGQVIEDLNISIPAGAVVPITVGAGGQGGQLKTSPVTLNYFLNPSFETSNTGWSTVSGQTSFGRSTSFNGYTPQLGYGGATVGYLYYSTNNNTHSFKYDSGNSAFTVDSGITGYDIRATFTGSTGSASFTYTTSIDWYADATLIRSDAGYTNQADSVIGTAWQWRIINLANVATAIPTNATRFVLNISITTTSTFQWGWDNFILSPRELSIYNYVPNGNYFYVDPTISFSGTAENPVFWAGTAHNSVTRFRGGAGRAINPGSNNFGGSAGNGGTRGGNSSVGTYAIAYGGGAGTGGGAHSYIYNGSWGNDGRSTNWQFRGNSDDRYGGNGGGAGGNGDNGQSPTNNSAGGGGGAGGFGGLAVTGTYGLNFTGSDTSSSASSTFFVTTQGGYAYKNIYAAGGMAGMSGAQAASSGNGSSGFESPATTSNLPANPLSTATPGGGRGFSTRPGSGGAGGPGSNGTNATLTGSGGGGGGGGGSSTSVSQNSGTYAMPGNGGNGGNGAAGLVILSWFE